MEQALIESLIDQVINDGKRGDSGYKPQVWEYTKIAVQRVAGSTQEITRQHCKNKHETLKKDWRVWVALTTQSGFSLDENGVVTGDQMALEAYYRAHKEARKFKNTPIKFGEELRQLFEGVLATGEEAVTVEDIIGGSADELAASIEGDSSLTATTTDESSPPIWQRKRSIPASFDRGRSVRTKKNNSTKAGEQADARFNEMTHFLSALVSTIGSDIQCDAIKSLGVDYHILGPTLQLVLVREFSNEFSAKSYLSLTPELRKRWVKEELESRREALQGVDFDGRSFESIMDSVDWSGGGVLTEKDAV